ncbi:hypothetical protein [Pandoraea capi]|nr:hypothetical protein [Pandoraea capi]
MQWLGAQQGFGSITDLCERVAICRGVANEGDEAAKALHVAQRMPDFQGASQRSTTRDNSFATLAAFGADFLDFLDELAQRGRNLSRQEHS